MKDLKAIEIIHKLDNTATRLHEATEIHQLGECITKIAENLLEAEYVCLYLIDPESGKLTLISSLGYTPDEIKKIEESAQSGLPADILQGRKMLYIPDSSKHHEPLTFPADNGQLQSLLFIPIEHRSTAIGVIGAKAVRADAFQDEEIAMLSFLANQAGVVYSGIAERKSILQAEEILKLHDRALMTSSNGIVITDAIKDDNPIIYVNNAFERITGYSKQEVIGANCRFLSSVETDRQALRQLREAINAQTECAVLLLNKRKDGTPFWNDLRISPLKNDEGITTHFIGVQEDVTEKIIAGRELRDASVRIATLLQNLQTGILVEDEFRRIVLANTEYCTMFGITAPPDALIGFDCSTSAEQFKHLFADGDQFILDIEKTLFEKKVIRGFEVLLADGRVFERDYIPIFTAETYMGHLWQYRDITGRKSAEMQLRQSEEKYRKIVDLASEIIFRISADGKLSMVNPKAVQVMGYSENELIGMQYYQLVRHDYKDRIIRYYQNQVLKRIPDTYLEFPVITKSGAEIWFGQNVHILLEGERITGLQSVARDITQIRKYQDDIKALKEFYERILNDLPGQVAVFDRDLRYLFVNPESIKNDELREWIIGRDDFEYCRRRGVDESVAESRQAFLKKAMESKKLESFEEKITHPDGRTMHFFRAVSPILDRYKNVIRLIGYGIDITARKQAEEDRDRFFNLSTDLLCIAGFDGNFKRINPAFEKLLGYSADELLSSPFTDFIYAANLSHTIQTIRSVQNGGTISDFENRFVCKDGSLRWISWQATAFVEGSALYAVGRDITQRKHIEEELLRAKSAAEESTKAKDRFLAHMSHEIRTPMNAVLGLSHLLLEMHPTTEQEQFLNAIKFSSENLLVIINDILDFSKIEAGKIDYAQEPFLLDELLYQIQQTVTFSKSEKNIDFIVEINPTVPNVLIGDAVRLNQILLNLVSNAVKFTIEGSVTIHCRTWEERPESVTLMFQVKDTGIGIGKENLERIFERFEQVGDNRKDRMQGTGLGLAIVKGLIENQGGSIVAESVPGKGSVFTILMPFNRPDTMEQSVVMEYGKLPEPEYSNDDISKLRVLIAEDNEMNQLVVTSMLKLWGLSYTIAQNGQEAFLEARDNNYDVILMDISMPVLNGYEATAKIRTELPAPKNAIYIIALTASAMLESRELVMKSGMNDYLSKPFKPNELQFKLAKAQNLIPSIATQPLPVFASSRPGNTVVDLTSLFEMVGGDVRTMNEMIYLFIQQTPEALEKIRMLIVQQDWPEICKTAHRLRPTLSYMGLTEAMEAMGHIEKSALQNHDAALITSLLEKVATIIELALPELRAALKKV